jgi:hypothetical protein
MYPWLKFLHVLAIFGFLMAHGVTVSVYFTLRHQRDVDRIRMLLQMSSSALVIMDLSLLLLLVSGIIAGFIGQWWSHVWIWLSLGLLIALLGAMEMLGVRTFNAIRLGVGLASSRGQKQLPELMSAADLDSLLSRTQPMRLTVVGFGGLAVIGWLMVFKPF